MFLRDVDGMVPNSGAWLCLSCAGEEVSFHLLRAEHAQVSAHTAQVSAHRSKPYSVSA